MHAIERVDEVPLGGGDAGGLLIIRFDVQHRRAFTLNLRALIQRREIAAHPVFDVIDRQPVLRIGQHHVSGQILVFTAEPVGDPRAERRVAGENLAALPLVTGRLMVFVHVVHGADDRNLIDHLSRVRQQFAHPRAALAMPGKLPMTAHHLALHAAPGRGDLGEFLRCFLPVILVQRRLGIKQVHLRRPALHAKLDDRLGPRRKVRLARARIHRQCWLVVRFLAVQIARQQRGQRHAVQAVLHTVKKLPAVDEVRVHINQCTKTPRC